jgi:outer membrane protein TolC
MSPHFPTALLLLALLSPAATAQFDVLGSATITAPADTALSVLLATMEVERARLDRARLEAAEAASWRARLPSLSSFASLSTRGHVFAPVRSDGYDPRYAEIARWPGDSWGLTASWSLDRLDPAPRRRARAALSEAEARFALAEARTEAARLETRHRDRERRLARERLDQEVAFLADRLALERELLRLAEHDFEHGDGSYATLVQRRLATRSAEYALARAETLREAAEGGQLPPDAWSPPYTPPLLTDLPDG